MAASVSWTAGSQAAMQAVTFVTTVVLARLLAPSDFGLVGMAAVYTGLVTMLGEMGLGAALVQRRDISERDLDTVFWSGLAAAAVIYAASFALSPVASWFFRDPEVGAMVRVSSVAFVVTSVGTVHKALLNKAMRFDRLARAEVTAILSYGCIAVALAVAGFGAWAIVFGQVARAAVEVLVLWLVERWRPRVRFEIASFKGLFGFGANVWAFNFVNYARENVDFLVVGRVLGATQLGLYTFGYNLANLPRRQLISIVGRVTFPAFSKVQDDDESLRAIYAKVIRFVSLFSFPLLSGLAVVAPLLVPLVYGEKWLPSVLPIQVLCGAGMLYSLGGPSGSVFLAKGRPGLLLKISVISLSGLLLMLLWLVRYGIVGVSVAVLTYTVLSLSIGQFYTNSLIGLRMRTYLRALVPASVACIPLVSAVAVLGAVQPQTGAAGSLVWLGVEVVAGGAAYLLALRALGVSEARDAYQYVLGGLQAAGRHLLRRESVPAAVAGGSKVGDSR
jgi:PST family polysaccharide transporter